MMKSLRHILILLAWFTIDVEAETQLVPNELANVEGDGASGFGSFGIPTRTQTIYNGTLFTDPMATGARISAIAFRVDGAGFPFVGRPEIEIRMSTSLVSEGSLTPSWALNTGPDEVVVFPRATINLTSGFVFGGPNSFSAVVPLPNHFDYNPRSGNLLIDILAYEPGSMPRFDGQYHLNDGLGQISGRLNDSFGSESTFGWAIQFTFEPIPEPSAWALVFCGSALLVIWRKFVAS